MHKYNYLLGLVWPVQSAQPKKGQTQNKNLRNNELLVGVDVHKVADKSTIAGRVWGGLGGGGGVDARLSSTVDILNRKKLYMYLKYRWYIALMV